MKKILSSWVGTGMKEVMEKEKEKKEHAKQIKDMIRQIETRGKKKQNIVDNQRSIITLTRITKTVRLQSTDVNYSANDCQSGVCKT